MKRSITIVSFAGLCAIAAFIFVQFAGSNGNTVDAKNAANAAFRDGVYQARLAAERGEEPRLTPGRWSNDSDRQAYVAGYQQTFEEARERGDREEHEHVSLPQSNQTNSSVAPDASAAFRDGVYQARLAAESGGKPHLSTGRWSKDSDRRAYVAGYQQEYLQARGEDGITVPQGIEQAGYRDGLEDGAHDRQSGDAPRPAAQAKITGNAAYHEAYATGYQLAFYGEQQVQNALVIRPVVSR